MNTRRTVATLAVAALLAGPAWTMDDVGGPPPLFELEGAIEAVEGPASVVARQQVAEGSIAFDALTHFATGGRDNVLDVTVRLFEGPIVVRLHKVSVTGENEFLLTGHPLSRPGNPVILLLSPGRLAGRLQFGDEHYMIRKIGAAHFLLKVDPALLPPHAPPTLPAPSPSQAVDGEAPPHEHPATDCKLDEQKTISVLIVYTAMARSGAAQDAGNSSATGEIREDANIALGHANLALDNSDANTQFSATGLAVEVAYAETGNGYLALQHLYTPGHPLHEAVTKARQDARANLVALVIEHWDQACGAAPVMIDWNMHPDQTAFSVVRRSCLREGQYSLAHELAHSMGSAHDRAHASIPGLFAFSYGYTDYQEKLGTILSYGCPGCARLVNYSNPAVAFATGDASPPASGMECPTSDPDCRPTNNAQSINRAACQVVNWH